MCAHSADAVKQIQITLKAHGVKGKHTNAAMQTMIMEAVQMLEDIQVREHLLEKDPTHQMVTDIMDLYRQAAEKFELAGDSRHEEVVNSMKEFLAQSWVMSILEAGSGDKNKTVEGEDKGPKIDEALNPPDLQVRESDKSVVTIRKSEQEPQEVAGEGLPTEGIEDEDEKLRNEQEELQKAMKEAESILQSAHEGLADLTMDDFDDDDDLNFLSTSTAPLTSKSSEVGNDIVLEFEDMLADADKELSDIIGS